MFADHLAGLTAVQIATICEILVPIAARLTPGQIAVRLRRLIAAIDPRHYERRYRKALRDRLVTAWLDDTGTAVLSARGLTPTQAAAALERIDLLAHATRRTGHRSTLDQIRVDIVAGLLDGTLHHLTRDQIITHLITNRSTNDDPPATADEQGAPADTSTPAPTDGSDNGDGGVATDHGAGPNQADTIDSPTPHNTTAHDPANPTGDNPVTAPIDTAPDGGVGTSTNGSTAGDHTPREDPRTGVEIRVALSTLLGHNDHPGEIPGLGPIPATEARDTVAAQRRAEWRYAITDPHGRLLFDGITRRRPTGLATDGPPGGIVEIHIPATLLEHLTNTGTDPPDDPLLHTWASVLADIARQYTDRDHRDLDAHPNDRLPRAGLRRHTQIRDRTCIGVGCRQRPKRCDQDHTRDHQHGGPTTAADLAPLCRHDHLLKQAGWNLEQPAPGTFTWTSPLGGRYNVQPEPILPPLPTPRPSPDDPAHDQPAPASPETLILYRPEPPAPPDPPPLPDEPDEPPPF